ncbi:MAG: Flp pilus assembly protein CpaB [Thermoleophilia bacterium]|nr:Flp pilus assembly protein CpaB [Thermoleophilia bacterium]
MGRRTIAITIAILFALAAAALVWWYVGSVKETTSEDTVTRTVLVAAEDVPARTTGESLVEKRLVEPKDVPARYVAPGALASETELQGKILSANLAKGQQLVASQLGTAQTESVAFQVKSGMRAVSVPIDRERGVGGAIAAGDRVDVVATFKTDMLSQANVNLGAVLTPEERTRIQERTGIDLSASMSAVTRTVLQQVEVLGIDSMQSATETGGLTQDATNSGSDNPVVVLMVTPAEAEQLVFAQELGSVWFALVPAEDTTKVTTPGRSIVNEFLE